MSLINEALARAHCSERLAAAEREYAARHLARELRAGRRNSRSGRRVSRVRLVRKALAVRS